MRIRPQYFIAFFSYVAININAQKTNSILDGIEYNVEMQATSSFEGNEKTPLWLNANKYGLSSLENVNGYLRGSVIRPLRTDSAYKWGLGYGLDMAATYHFTSKAVVQQAFIEARWLHGTVSIGSKQYPMELKNNELSSGSQTLGINARPVPQVRIALPDYWTIPLTRGWLHLKGHVAFGMLTDENWQHDFTQKKSKYFDNGLYHSKAGYLKIGNEDVFFPFSLEMGLEMATIFGGTAYRPDENGVMQPSKGGTGLKDYWNAFMPGGSDNGETTYQNVSGDQLGSWVIRANWDYDTWNLGIYADHFFEDHSSMFLLDYNGYGESDEWQVRKSKRYFLYSLKDIMLGIELKLKYAKAINNILFEYLYTKYQSGPIYHDHTSTVSDHIGGIDNYYNHGINTGWQHWGQVMGNPLYLSPIYNEDGTIRIKDNRFYAFHLGVSGDPVAHLHYRILVSYEKGWGTYDDPYTEPRKDLSVLAEATYKIANKLSGWAIKGGFGLDRGRLMGNNTGFQFTISKSGIF